MIGPGPDIDHYDEMLSALPPPDEPVESLGVAVWKTLCPMCAKQSFNGWDCANTQCNYSIVEKMREMSACILSPEESARLRERLGIQ